MASVKERIFNHRASSSIAILLFVAWFPFVWFEKAPWWSIGVISILSISLLFVKDTTFRDTFCYCFGLTSIPAGLFDNNPLVTSFQGTFYYASSLITGNVPELWVNTAIKFPALTVTGGCFTNLTNASNYGSIPAAWR